MSLLTLRLLMGPSQTPLPKRGLKVDTKSTKKKKTSANFEPNKQSLHYGDEDNIFMKLKFTFIIEMAIAIWLILIIVTVK